MTGRAESFPTIAIERSLSVFLPRHLPEMRKLGQAKQMTNDKRTSAPLAASIIDDWLKQAEIIQVKDPDQALKLARQALEAAEQSGNQLQQAAAAQLVGNAFNKLRDYQEALSYLERCLVLYAAAEEIEAVANTHLDAGRTCFQIANYEQALAYFREAVALARQSKNRKLESRGIANLGMVLSMQGRLAEALECYFQSLRIDEASGDLQLIADHYDKIGIVHGKMGHNKEALQYHKKALKIYLQLKEWGSIVKAYNNIGIIYKHLKQYDRALGYYQKGIDIVNQHALHPRFKAVLLDNRGLAFFHKEKYQKAVECYLQGFEIFNELGWRMEVASTRTYLAQAYHKLGMLDKAAAMSSKAVSQLEQLDSKIELRDALEAPTAIFADRDAIYNEEHARQITEIETKYKTEQKEKEKEIYRLRNIELKKTLH